MPPLEHDFAAIAALQRAFAGGHCMHDTPMLERQAYIAPHAPAGRRMRATQHALRVMMMLPVATRRFSA